MKKLLSLITSLIFCNVLSAVQTQSVVFDSYNSFINGECINVSLSKEGILKISRELEILAEIKGPIIWDAITDKVGNIYVGAGNNGKLIKITTSGEVSTVFNSKEILIRSLAIDDNGVIYAGTSPSGKVYKIMPEKDPEIFFDPDETFIWDLVFDPQGFLYVATGEAARIYKVPLNHTPDNKINYYFQSDQNHITSIALKKNGILYAGSGEEGVLYRIVSNKESYSLYDSDSEEIPQVKIVNNKVFFSVFNSVEFKNKVTKKNKKKSNGKVVVFGLSGKSESGNKKKDKTIPGKVFVLDKYGHVDIFWENQNSALLSFSQNGENSLLVGDNDNGKIYQVNGLNDWALIQQAKKGGDISAIIPDTANKGSYIVVTSNPSIIYRLGSQQAQKGQYLTDVFDAKQIVVWGSLELQLESEIGFRPIVMTRSGNTESPNSSWNKWVKLKTDNDFLKILSPAARYLQCKIIFNDESNSNNIAISKIRFFYQLKNVAPVISDINIISYGLKLIKSESKSKDIKLQKLLKNSNKINKLVTPEIREELTLDSEEGLITVFWKAFDSNDDRLIYSVSLKKNHDSNWMVLADKIDQPLLTFNSKGLIEGYYRARVVASDEPNNNIKSIKVEKVSPLFLIDTSPPKLQVNEKKLSENSVELIVTSTDAWSVITSASYRINGGDIKSIRPIDELFDSKYESFTVKSENLQKGDHSYLFQILDESGHEAVIDHTVKIK